MSLSNPVKKNTFLEIVGAYLNSYSCSTLTSNSAWTIVASYLEFFTSNWSGKEPTKIGVKDLAKLFYEKDKNLESYFQANMFDHYVQLKAYVISNTEQAIEWFETLPKDLKIKFFNNYELGKIAEMFHISQKNHNSFIKAITSIGRNEDKPDALSSWYKRMKELKLKAIIAKEPRTNGKIIPSHYKSYKYPLNISFG